MIKYIYFKTSHRKVDIHPTSIRDKAIYFWDRDINISNVTFLTYFHWVLWHKDCGGASNKVYLGA